MNLAVIPARGGSSRIPGKNIKDFAGKPIIAYSIEAAQKTKLFDKIIVSTDSVEIAAIAEKYGANVPFMRPTELGKNEVSVADVLCHAVSWFENEGVTVDWLCCLVATAPFLRAKDIEVGCDIMKNSTVDTVMSVAKYGHSVFRAFKKNEDGLLSMIWPEYEFANSNDLTEGYHDAAQFYWLNPQSLLKNRSVFGRKTSPIILPDYLVCDIDTLEDWQRAEILFEICKQKKLF